METMKLQEIMIDGNTIFYKRENSGKRPMLFIHGFNSSMNFSDGLKKLERNYDMITIDLPGCGRSKTEHKLSIEFFNETVLKFIEKIKLKDFIVVGHSLGGATALEVSKLKECKNALLIAPFNPFINKYASKDKAKWLKPENLDQAKETFNNLVFNKERKVYWKNLATSSRLYLEKIKKTFKAFDFILVKQILSPEYGRTTLTDYYKNAPVKKVAIITGNEDRFVSKYSLEDVEKEFKFPVQFVENCGHSTIYEQSEIVNEFLNKFC